MTCPGRRGAFDAALAALCAGAALSALALALPLRAQTGASRAEALAKRATERIDALQREAADLAARERTLLGDLRQLELERQLKNEELERADAEVERVASELDAISARTATLQVRAQTDRPALRARVVELYKLGQARYLRLLLSANDPRHVAEAAQMVAAIAALDRQRFASYQQTLKELAAARATLETRRGELEAVRDQAAAAGAAAAQAAAGRDALIRQIDARRDLNAQLIGELQAAQQKLQLALRDLGSGAANDVSLPLRPFKGDLPWPVTPALTSPIARRPASDGINIPAPEGAPVYAVHAGVIAFAGPFAGFGNLVIVDHGSQTFSLYGNLLAPAAAKGARVDAGETVGIAGPSPTGSSAVYFELRVDGRPVDPLQWLKKRS